MWPFSRKHKKDTIQGSPVLVEAAASGIDPDEHLWMRLSGRAARDELSPYEHTKMIKMVSYLYSRNSMAKRLVELTRDFVLGEGVTFKAEDDAVQEVLDEFWKDPENQWDLKQHDRVLELGLYGEQCFVVFVNEFNGLVRVGNLDPALIESVSPDPNNSERANTVNIRTGAGGEIRPLKVIHLNDKTGLLEGECFYFSVNKLSHETRGKSDILALADWLDGYEYFLFNRLEKVAMAASFVWDVTLEGMNEGEIADWLKKNGKTPRPGSVRAHNEKVKWETAAPNLNADDAATEALLMKELIAGGSGKPLHWLGTPETTNRATAVAMGEPTLKSLQSRQKYVKYQYEFMGRFVIDQAIAAGRLSATVDKTLEAILPELSKKASKEITQSLDQLSKALASAQQQGWISKETARELFSLMAELLGKKVNVEVEEEKIKAEKLDQAKNDLDRGTGRFRKQEPPMDTDGN